VARQGHVVAQWYSVFREKIKSSVIFFILLRSYAQFDGTIGISEWFDCFLHMDGSVSFLIRVPNVHRPNICISFDHMAAGSDLLWL